MNLKIAILGFFCSWNLLAQSLFIYGGTIINKKTGERIAAHCGKTESEGPMEGKCIEFDFYKLPVDGFPDELVNYSNLSSVNKNVGLESVQMAYSLADGEAREGILFLIKRENLNQVLRIKEKSYRSTVFQLGELISEGAVEEVGIKFGIYRSSSRMIAITIKDHQWMAKYDEYDWGEVFVKGGGIRFNSGAWKFTAIKKSNDCIVLDWENNTSAPDTLCL